MGERVQVGVERQGPFRVAIKVAEDLRKSALVFINVLAPVASVASSNSALMSV